MSTMTHNGTNGAVLRVSLVYLLTGFVTFLSMGLLGLLMRLNHAGWIRLSPDWFYRILTIHGTGMVTGMLLSGFTEVLSSWHTPESSKERPWTRR